MNFQASEYITQQGKTQPEYEITRDEKTQEQKAREFKRLKEIEGERAKQRQGTRNDIVENFPQCSAGKSRDLAAAKVGISGKTAEKAASVVDVIDALEADGEKEQAADLRDKLNNGSVTAAHRAAQPIIDKKKEIIEEVKKCPFEIEKIDNGLFIAHANNPNYSPSFNATNDNIEWAKWSWNPVTGCLHGCEYCYARSKANNPYYKEAFPTGFAPTFHPGRLSAPGNTRIPSSRLDEPGINNVFVCSMADLFGDWVPAEWINAVLDSCQKNSGFNFLFLTKNPKRYLEFDFPENAWIGATVDNNNRLPETTLVFDKLRKKYSNVLFISCEPLTEHLDIHATNLFSDTEREIESYYLPFDWIIIGGLKGSENTDRQPEWEWVESILTEARKAECSVYFKPNLTVRPKEYPF